MSAPFARKPWSGTVAAMMSVRTRLSGCEQKDREARAVDVPMKLSRRNLLRAGPLSVIPALARRSSTSLGGLRFRPRACRETASTRAIRDRPGRGLVHHRGNHTLRSTHPQLGADWWVTPGKKAGRRLRRAAARKPSSSTSKNSRRFRSLTSCISAVTGVTCRAGPASSICIPSGS